MFMRISAAVVLVAFSISGCVTTETPVSQSAQYTPQSLAAHIDTQFGGDANAMNTASVNGDKFADNAAELFTAEANKPLLDVMFSRGYNPNAAAYTGEGSPLTVTKNFDMQRYLVSKGATFEAAELMMENNVHLDQGLFPSRSFFSPLLMAYWNSNPEHIAWLIQNGSRSIINDTWGTPVLISRQGKTDAQVMEELVRYSAEWGEPKIMKGFVLAGHGQLVQRITGSQGTATASNNTNSNNDSGGAFAAMLGGIALGAVVGGDTGNLITSATTEIAVAAATDGNVTSAIGSAANMPELAAFGAVVDSMIQQMDGASQSTQPTPSGANSAPTASSTSSVNSGQAQKAATNTGQVQQAAGPKTFKYNEMFRPVCPSGNAASQDIPVKANDFMCYQAMKTYAYAASCNMVDDLKAAQDQYYSACAAEIYSK